MKNNFKDFFKSSQVLSKLKAKTKSFLWVLGKDAFLFILFIFLLEIIFAEVLFYQYVLSVEIEEPSLSDGSVGFQEEEYQSVLKEWQNREDFFINYPAQNPKNPFQ